MCRRRLLLPARGLAPFWHLAAGAARLGQADGDRLLAALHPLAGAAAAQRAALPLVHRAFDLRLGFASVLGHDSLPHSTLALALSPRTNSSTLCCCSCCAMRGFTSSKLGNFTGRTSSS